MSQENERQRYAQMMRNYNNNSTTNQQKSSFGSKIFKFSGQVFEFSIKFLKRVGHFIWNHPWFSLALIVIFILWWTGVVGGIVKVFTTLYGVVGWIVGILGRVTGPKVHRPSTSTNVVMGVSSTLDFPLQKVPLVNPLIQPNLAARQTWFMETATAVQHVISIIQAHPTLENYPELLDSQQDVASDLYVIELDTIYFVQTYKLVMERYEKHLSQLLNEIAEQNSLGSRGWLSFRSENATFSTYLATYNRLQDDTLNPFARLARKLAAMIEISNHALLALDGKTRLQQNINSQRITQAWSGCRHVSSWLCSGETRSDIELLKELIKMDGHVRLGVHSTKRVFESILQKSVATTDLLKGSKSLDDKAATNQNPQNWRELYNAVEVLLTQVRHMLLQIDPQRLKGQVN